MTVTDPLLTANHSPVTRSNPKLSNCCEHCQTDLHAIGAMVAEMHGDWVRYKPMLSRLLDNPAARWKARRNSQGEDK